MQRSVLQTLFNTLLTKTASVFYWNPSQETFVIWITGTTWKTTTWLILNYLLNKLIWKTALLTPDFYYIWEQKFQKKNKLTPMSVNSFIAEMKAWGCQVCIILLSAKDIANWLLDSVQFDMWILTNVKTDNDDEIQMYKNLFLNIISSKKANKTAVLPKDDRVWNTFYHDLVFGKVINFGIVWSANLKADNIVEKSQFTEFDCLYLWNTFKVKTSIVWYYNIYHLLAAVGALIIIWVDLNNIIPLLNEIPTTLVNMPKLEKKNWFNWFDVNIDNPDLIYQTWSYIKSLFEQEIQDSNTIASLNSNLTWNFSKKTSDPAFFVIKVFDKKYLTKSDEDIIAELEIYFSLNSVLLVSFANISDLKLFYRFKTIWPKLSRFIWNDFFYFNSKKVLNLWLEKNAPKNAVVMEN